MRWDVSDGGRRVITEAGILRGCAICLFKGRRGGEVVRARTGIQGIIYLFFVFIIMIIKGFGVCVRIRGLRLCQKRPRR